MMQLLIYTFSLVHCYMMVSMDRSPYEQLVAKPWQKSEIHPFIGAYELQIQKLPIETLGPMIWILILPL